MTAAALLAFLAGGCSVAAAWELLGVLQDASAHRAVRRVLGPLQHAGRTGREASCAERRRLALLATATLLAGGWLLGGPVLGAALAVAAPLAVSRLLAARRRRWRRDLAAGAGAAARAMADALAAGHAFRGAVAVAARDGGVPGAAGRELAEAAAALEVGATTPDVLARVRERAQDPAWDAIVAAVSLQTRTGGDLATLLRGIATSREEARRVEADARSLTAQARFTANLVCGLPVAALGLAELAAPGFIGALASSPVSLALVVTSAVLQLCALGLVGRLARVGEAT